MRAAVAIPAAATATEHSQRREDRWQILGVASATEHSELNFAAERETAMAPRVISIGSVKFLRAARHDRTTRAMELVRHGIQDRLRLTISWHEISDHCDRSATEHTSTRAYPYNQRTQRSWSGTVEAISRSVAAYQRAAHATEQSACADIMRTLKSHVQALLKKCRPGAYLRDCALDIIMAYIWSRICNVAFLMLREDIYTNQWPPEKLSQSELNDCFELVETCQHCLKNLCDEILTDLKHFACSATEPTNTSLATACRTCLHTKQVERMLDGNAPKLDWDALLQSIQTL